MFSEELEALREECQDLFQDGVDVLAHSLKESVLNGAHGTIVGLPAIAAGVEYVL